MRFWPTISLCVAASFFAAPALACGDEPSSQPVIGVSALLDEASRFDALARSNDTAAKRVELEATRTAERAVQLRREARLTEASERFDLLSRAETMDARAAMLRSRALELRMKSQRARQEAADLRQQAGRSGKVRRVTDRMI